MDSVIIYQTSKFKLRQLGVPKYFLGLEVARLEDGILICQRKYYLDLLNEYGMLGSKLVKTPIDVNHHLNEIDEDFLPNETPYRKLAGKLIYLTFTHSYIIFSAYTLPIYEQA